MFSIKQITIILLLSLFFSASANAQTKLSAQILKKIEENTPKALPQTPVVPKLKSDAQDGYLKGKVKHVIEETESFTEVVMYQGRHFSGISEFDENGNFTKEVYFNATGKPYEAIVYGYIDGFRASMYQTFSTEKTALTIRTPQKEIDVKKTTPDLRYDYRYEYKYANDKLAEMQMFHNDGRKGMRYVYNHSKNRLEKLAFDEDGKLNQKYVTVFDDKGNEIEWYIIAVINLAYNKDVKMLIKNESFDKQGNWIKRTFSKVIIENGKEVHAPLRIEYRTITYYP